MKDLARKSLQKIKIYKPGKHIEEVKRQLGLKDIMKLSSNENPLAPPHNVIASIINASKTINRYPDYECFYLKRELAKRFSLSHEDFVIGNGSDEIILLALRAFLEEGDEVLIAKPSFLIYEIASRISGARVKIIPLRNYRYNLSAMKKAITRKTKIVFIANPNNPTGTYVTKNEVDKFMSGLDERIIVFFDEAYYEFAEDLDDYPDTLKFLNNLKNRIIITRTFSKAYGLAGIRVGYGIADRELVEYMSNVREPFSVNSLAQAAAMAALKEGDYVKKTMRMAREGKRYLCREFDKMEIKHIPSATNFILFKIKGASMIFKGLIKGGIIVRDMAPWGLEGFLRVSVGTMSENRRFIRVLKIVIRILGERGLLK